MPWEVLLLFGGGLSMAAAISDSGLAVYLGSLLEVARAAPRPLMMLLLATTMIFVTELTSNTASAATFLPIGGALAMAVGADPLTFTIPLALAATCGFMMPVGTQPHAIIYGTGRITIQDMMGAGLWINLATAPIITVAVMILAPLVFFG